MKLFSTPLMATLLGSVLLASCNSAPGTGGGTNNQGINAGNGSTNITTPIGPLIARTVTLGLPGNPKAEVLLPNTRPNLVSAELESAPAGLTVSIGSPAGLPTGDVSVPLTVSGDAQPGDFVKVKVTVSGSSRTVELPVMKFRAQPIKANGLTGSYGAASMQFLPDGSALLTSLQDGDETARHSLLKVDASGQSFTRLPLPVITLFGDAVTSQTTGADGTTWMTVRGTSSEGSYLLSRDLAGNVKKYAADAQGDNLNNATLSGGQVWFTQYSRAALKTLAPASGTVKSFPVTEKADSLVAGSNGQLYYASFYARPAIVQFNPTTGSSQSFNVGEANRSLPTGLRAAPDGTIWFLESLSSSVWQLNPRTGQQTRFALPFDASPNALALAPSGQVWVSDATNARLYTSLRHPDGSSALVGISTPQGGAHALTISPTGKAWFEAGGNLYVQQ